jgi:HEAT repeat protein
VQGELATVLARLASDDPLVQNEGVAGAVALGAEAVPSLLPLLDDPQALRRSQVAYALSAIGDPRAIPAFRKGLDDPDERVRAYSAVGLARLHTEDASAACVRTLDDAPDPLHADVTPAVDALGEMGLPAAPALLPALGSADQLTRLHAQRALEAMVSRAHGWVPGRGFPSPADDRAAAAEWRARGDYSADAPPSVRAASIEAWRNSLRIP